MNYTNRNILLNKVKPGTLQSNRVFSAEGHRRILAATAGESKDTGKSFKYHILKSSEILTTFPQ